MKLMTKVSEGTTVVVYTSRERLDLGEGRGEEELALSVKISNAVTQFVNQCHPQPRFVIAKGGITSSDVGTIGLESEEGRSSRADCTGRSCLENRGRKCFSGNSVCDFPRECRRSRYTKGSRRKVAITNEGIEMVEGNMLIVIFLLSLAALVTNFTPKTMYSLFECNLVVGRFSCKKSCRKYYLRYDISFGRNTLFGRKVY